MLLESALAISSASRSGAGKYAKLVKSWLLKDLVPLGAVMGLSAVAQPHLFAPTTLVSLDTSSQFYPWYTYLGENLRAGHIPGWNPAIFSGAPFAANPLSGWTYLPAMLLFTLLPMAEAARAYLLVHPLLAGCGTLALARILGIGRAGAVVAGVAYANTGFLQVQNACCFAFASVYTWLPIALLGVELALRSETWRVRAAWWGLAGLAISQIFAAWLGQGAYYATLLIGGYTAYRTLGASSQPLPIRLRSMLVHAGAVFLVGVGLDAAGLLPRLEFNTLSSLAGGYTGAEAKVGGLHPKDWVLLATPGFWYVGLSVLALACAAGFLVRGRWTRPLWFFGATSILAVLVSGTVETPLHWLLYHVLPGFARLHPHAPERILTVAYLGPALLAGATVSTVVRSRIAAGLLLVVVADLALGGAKARGDWMLRDPLNGADKLTPVDLATYYVPDPAAAFLRQQQAELPGRYIGYAPYIKGEPWPYSTRFMDPATAALQVDNRALSLGLQDVQGYDASHLERYDEYIAALNGRTQNYHDAEVFRAGLRSPLLDVLNVRFVIVAAQAPLDGFDETALARFSTTVYQDKRVRILENSSALPRAWIVHTAAQVARVNAAAAIADGRIDPRRTALMEEPPPALAPPVNPSDDIALVQVYEPDRVSLSTFSDTSGILVLSEIDYPAWHAYVDDLPAHTYTVDGALRAVPVPEGQHKVEFRFESVTLQLGLLISGATLVIVAGLVILATTAGRRGGG